MFDVFGSAEEFLDSDASRASVCLILDVNLPGMSGLELQQRLNASRLEVPIIFISAQADEAMKQDSNSRASRNRVSTRPRQRRSTSFRLAAQNFRGNCLA